MVLRNMTSRILATCSYIIYVYRASYNKLTDASDWLQSLILNQVSTCLHGFLIANVFVHKFGVHVYVCICVRVCMCECACVCIHIQGYTKNYFIWHLPSILWNGVAL